MAAPQAQTKRTKIRKIFKKGEEYLCGLCGKTYDNLPAAKACLAACTPAFLSEGPTPEAGTKRYRCSLCKRIYDSMDAAKNCSATCRHTIEQRADLEKKVGTPQTAAEKLKVLASLAKDPTTAKSVQKVQAKVDQQLRTEAPLVKAALPTYKPKSNELLAGENIKFQREKNMFRCLRCKQRYSNADDARSCFDAHADGPTRIERPKSTDPRYVIDGKKFRCTKCERPYGQASDAITCHDSHEQRPVAKEEDSRAFFRDGARYICRKCSKKYFERQEVIACFDGHPPDFEKPVGGPKTEEEAVATPEIPEIIGVKKGDDHKFYRDGAKYVCRGCSKKYFSREETAACFDGHEGPVDPTIEGVVRVEGDDDKFIRDGAKYVCKTCRAKYFTRSEVINCFDSHSP